MDSGHNSTESEAIPVLEDGREASRSNEGRAVDTFERRGQDLAFKFPEKARQRRQFVCGCCHILPGNGRRKHCAP